MDAPASIPSPPVPLGSDLRPVPRLFKLYVLQSLVTGPLLPLTLPYFYFRYHTLRYRFDQEGISMAWGILFRREIHLTYARIQDIHLTSHVVERFLGLARIQIQTASGKAGAEMVLEGLPNHLAVRDFLYARMRGASVDSAPGQAPGPIDGMVPALRDLTVALQGLQQALRDREIRP